MASKGKWTWDSKTETLVLLPSKPEISKPAPVVLSDTKLYTGLYL